MAKLIYCLKIYIFRSQFLTPQEKNGLCHFNIFVLSVYVKYWYNAQSTISAPTNDLNLIKALVGYKNINKKVAEMAIKSFSNHFWYLSKTLIGLAFFVNQVTILQYNNTIIITYN